MDKLQAGVAREHLGRAREHLSVFQRFFDDYCPGVEGWLARCDNVQLVKKPRTFWFPEIHLHYEWAVRGWYYRRVGRGPYWKQRRECEQWSPVIPRISPCRQYNETLYRRMRTDGHAIVTAAFRIKPWVQRIVDEIWQKFNPGKKLTLGVHLRGSDKINKVSAWWLKLG